MAEQQRLGRGIRPSTPRPCRVPTAPGLRHPPQESILSERGRPADHGLSPGRRPPPWDPPRVRGRGTKQRSEEAPGPTPDLPTSHRAVAPNGPRLIRLTGLGSQNRNLLPARPPWEAIPARAPSRKGGWERGSAPTTVRKRGVGIHS